MEAKLDYRVVNFMGRVIALCRVMWSRYHVKTRVQKHVVFLNTCSEVLNFRPELSAEEAKGGEDGRKVALTLTPNPNPNVIA